MKKSVNVITGKVVEFLKKENNAEDSYGADIQEKIQTAAVKAAKDPHHRRKGMNILKKQLSLLLTKTRLDRKSSKSL